MAPKPNQPLQNKNNVAPRSGNKNTPAWLRAGGGEPFDGAQLGSSQLGGGNKNNNGLAQRPDNYKGDNGMAQRPDNYKGNNDDVRKDGMDWGQAGAGAAREIPVWLQVLLGAAGGGAQHLLPDKNDNDKLARRPMWMRSDQLSPHSAPKNLDQLSPHNGGGYGPGGFGSSYGGNWRRGGGGGGWDGGGGYSDTPAWLNQYLNLNSWNI